MQGGIAVSIPNGREENTNDALKEKKNGCRDAILPRKQKRKSRGAKRKLYERSTARLKEGREQKERGWRSKLRKHHHISYARAAKRETEGGQAQEEASARSSGRGKGEVYVLLKSLPGGKGREN